MIRRKLRQGIARYLPGAVSGTLVAGVAATVADWLTGTAVLTALASTKGERAGYAGLILTREVLHARRVRAAGARHMLRQATRSDG